MSTWTIIHFYPLEDARKCIFLEAIQVPLLSVLCKRGISVECRKENTQWAKECSLFHVSASLFLLCNICLCNFIWFPKNIQYCFRFFPISAVQYLPVCSAPQIPSLGKHRKLIRRQISESSVPSLFGYIPFLSFSTSFSSCYFCPRSSLFSFFFLSFPPSVLVLESDPVKMVYWLSLTLSLRPLGEICHWKWDQTWSFLKF